MACAQRSADAFGIFIRVKPNSARFAREDLFVLVPHSVILQLFGVVSPLATYAACVDTGARLAPHNLMRLQLLFKVESS